MWIFLSNILFWDINQWYGIVKSLKLQAEEFRTFIKDLNKLHCECGEERHWFSPFRAGDSYYWSTLLFFSPRYFPYSKFRFCLNKNVAIPQWGHILRFLIWGIIISVLLGKSQLGREENVKQYCLKINKNIRI